MNDFRLIFQAHATIKRLINQKILSTIGISLSQAGALVQLTQSEHVSCQALARRLGCGTGRISRMIHDLETRGLVDCRRSSTDRRVLELSLTTDGALLAHRVPSVLLNAERVALKALPDDERRFLLGFLSRMIDSAAPHDS